MSRLTSWLPIPATSHFSLANIPFGIISSASAPTHRPATIIGDHVLDLEAFSQGGGFKELDSIKDHLNVFSKPSLNEFAALGRSIHSQVRSFLQKVLTDDTPFPKVLRDNDQLKARALLSHSEVKMHMPMEIGDYTDFFAGINHAFTVGSLFRGPENALQPNYKHLPVAYHSRASSVVVSGTPVRRPWGQILTTPPTTVPKIPTFAPCRRLDIELELAAFICKSNALGDAVPVDEAEQTIFGYVLMNDWSARDIQMWEYVPLGPFNAKNFATTISAWIVLPDALQPFAVTGILNDTDYAPYLKESRPSNQYDIRLQVDLTTSSGKTTTTVTETNAKNLIWSFPQMIAHHTISGCPMRPGDLLGSGTISGDDDGSRGSLLEQNRGGKQTIKLNEGEERVFLQDGDSVTIYGVAGSEGNLVGFGECSGKVLEAHKRA